MHLGYSLGLAIYKYGIYDSSVCDCQIAKELATH